MKKQNKKNKQKKQKNNLNKITVNDSGEPQCLGY